MEPMDDPGREASPARARSLPERRQSLAPSLPGDRPVPPPAAAGGEVRESGHADVRPARIPTDPPAV
jgi:hypothetical protein